MSFSLLHSENSAQAGENWPQQPADEECEAGRPFQQGPLETRIFNDPIHRVAAHSLKGRK
jgi:hypothetical protein